MSRAHVRSPQYYKDDNISLCLDTITRLLCNRERSQPDLPIWLIQSFGNQCTTHINSRWIRLAWINLFDHRHGIWLKVCCIDQKRVLKEISKKIPHCWLNSFGWVNTLISASCSQWPWIDLCMDGILSSSCIDDHQSSKGLGRAPRAYKMWSKYKSYLEIEYEAQSQICKGGSVHTKSSLQGWQSSVQQIWSQKTKA